MTNSSIVMFLPHLDVSGGLGVHCRMLLAALDGVAAAHRCTVVVPADPTALFLGTGLERFDRASVAATFCDVSIPGGFNLASALDPILDDLVAAVRPDLVYCSYYTGMKEPGVPQVITFHDAGFLENPAGFGPTAARRLQTLNAIRPAITHIHCISADARDRICRLLPWDGVNTTVVWHALPDSLKTLKQAGTLNPSSVIVASRSLAEFAPYFFLPVGAATGFNRVRKNVPMAIRAFRKLKSPVRLLIAGTAHLTDTVLTELLPNSETGSVADGCWHSGDGRVVIVPTLPRVEFLAAMGHAVAVVYPSRYEGFGLPVLEAMAVGVPLIASRATSLPEIAGDAALLVDPDDESALAAAMTRVINDAELRAALVQKGRQRCERFTLEAMGRGMIAIFDATIADASAKRR